MRFRMDILKGQDCVVGTGVCLSSKAMIVFDGNFCKSWFSESRGLKLSYRMSEMPVNMVVHTVTRV